MDTFRCRHLMLDGICLSLVAGMDYAKAVPKMRQLAGRIEEETYEVTGSQPFI